MNEAKIVGIKNVKYQSKKTGTTVEGIQLNITYPHKDVSGEEVGTIYVAASSPEYDKVKKLMLNDNVKFVTSYGGGRYFNVYVGKAEK